ncbi:UNVERIFIED_CONTAM: hypothetical protein FKN15_060728 [Acipenser sinensis]
MPLFINANQIFTQRVNLLEHKLRGKEERIIQLETENALLHLKLAECYGKLGRNNEEEAYISSLYQDQLNRNKNTNRFLNGLFKEVQVLKQNLRDLSSIYAGFSKELEQQSKNFLNKVIAASCKIQDCSVDVNSLRQLQRKWFMQLMIVYSPDDSQQTVFEEVLPLLTSLLDGYNVCIMAYGQTGSGKTHTMIGPHTENGFSTGELPEEGVIPKATRELFSLISKKSPGSHSVEVSVVEVYNNEIFDLLAKDGDGSMLIMKRDVITTSTGNSDVPSLTHESVENAAEIMHVFNHGLQLRAKHPTLVHADSSRSHLVVTITVTTQCASAEGLAFSLQSVRQESLSHRSRRQPPKLRVTDEQTMILSRSPSPRPSLTELPVLHKPVKTKLQLVDLAGSECVGMSGVTGVALRETSFINRSLSALSDVLGALAEQRPHIPYRNSKLTHHGKFKGDSLGKRGDAKLLVMLCVSPTQRYMTESLQSLGFGTRARQVQRGQPRKKLTKSKPSLTELPVLHKPVKTKLQLVDLAGSECVGMSGVTGVALRETSFINRSLSALSDVLGALAEQRPHIPYRNSKLTHHGKFKGDSLGKS